MRPTSFRVRRAPDGQRFVIETASGVDPPATIVPPANAGEMERGFVIVRPECMNFLDERAQTENVIEVRLHTEFLLGSRIRYTADLDGLPLIVERLREEGAHFERDQRILAGWQTADSYFVSD